MEDIKIAVISFKLRAPWVHSLKEKRMIVKSLIGKIQSHFHVSVSEIGEMDTHQIIVIGACFFAPTTAIADSMMDKVSLFVEENTEAEILEEDRDIR